MEKVFGYHPLLNKIVQFLDIETILSFMKTSYDSYIVARKYRYLSEKAPYRLRFVKYDIFDAIVKRGGQFRSCDTGYIPSLEMLDLDGKQVSLYREQLCEAYILYYIENIRFILEDFPSMLKKDIYTINSFLSKHPIIRRVLWKNGVIKFPYEI
jgi:hypothetical protein